MRTVVAIDNSGSTSGAREYWDTVEKVCASLDSKEMYVWGSVCAPVSKFTDIRQGDSGGTDPQVILPLLNENTRLILFTDGQIGQSEVEACERYGLKLSSSEIYVISLIEDYSAVIPFARAGPTVIHSNGKLVLEGRIDFDPATLTLDDVVNNFDAIANRIQFSNMGRDNARAKVTLCTKRAEFLRAISVANGSFSTELSVNNINNILLKSVNVLDLIKKIDMLVSYCDMRNTYRLETNRENRAPTVNVVAEPEEVDADSSFECPIIMDADVPALLMCEKEYEFSSSEINMVANCPLYLVNIPDALMCTDHPIGVLAFNELGDRASPFTRRRVVGCIPLGCVAQHVSVGNSTIARVFSKGKLMGNPTLYLCALYHHAKNTQYLSSNTEFMRAFEDHLRFRLRTYRTNIALSGEPQFPLIKVPIMLALYYCCLTEARLYQFYYYIDALFDSLKLFNELPDVFYDEVRGKCERIRKLARYLNEYKDNPVQFRARQRALYQAHIIINGTYVFLDGENARDNERPVERVDELIDEYSLMNRISSEPQLLTLSKYTLPPCISPPEPERNFGSVNYELGVSIPICPKTCRPYIRPGGTGFEQLCESKYHIHHKCLPLYEYYIDYTCHTGAYPSTDELLLYTWAKVTQRVVNVTTLPCLIQGVISECIADFAEVSKMPVEEFIRIATASRPRDVRARMEQN
jgi:hypothetical protein